MKKILFCVFVFLIGELSYFAIPSISQEYLISIDFQQVSLGSVLRVLSSKTGRKFITDTKLSQKRIVLQLKDGRNLKNG